MGKNLGIVAAVSFMASIAFAGTIHVPADYSTIQAAIDAAQKLDTIIVAPGKYAEIIAVGPKVLTLRSANPTSAATVAATIIDFPTLNDVVSFSPSPDPDQVKTSIDGLTISGGGIGINGYGATFDIKNCVIRGNLFAGVMRHHGNLENCVIRGNYHGVQSQNGTIKNCRIEGNIGLGVGGGDGDIIDSVIDSNGHGGFAYGGGDFIHCSFSRNGGAGIIWHSGRLSRSIISGNVLAGIYGNNSDGGQVENCIISGNAQAGVQLSRKNFLSTTITGNRGFGFLDHTGQISHCIVWDNEAGDFSNSTQAVFSTSNDPLFIEPGFWETYFVWRDGDYRLAVNSPAIEAGDFLYLSVMSPPATDFDGNPRLYGTLVDLGAFEFQGDVDSDGDGIPNVPDVCDDTPQGIIVDSEGRPAADLNHDCVVDLLDFATFQNDLFGP